MDFNILLVFILTSLCIAHATTILDSFSNFSVEKKLYAQSQKTYEKFKVNLIKKLLQKEITTEEIKNRLIEGLRDAGAEKEMKEFLQKGGVAEDPQIYLGKLAFLYTVQNKANLAAAMSLIRICGAENLLKAAKNPNVCNSYGPYLIKLIEKRIGIVTSRILYSSGILGIPRGWINHVQNMAKDLETSGILSDSFKNLVYLLRGVAQNNEEIDNTILPNSLVPKTLSPSNYAMLMEQQGNQVQVQAPATVQPIIISPPPPQKITIDARNLAPHHSSNEQTLDVMMRQVMEKMLI